MLFPVVPVILGSLCHCIIKAGGGVLYVEVPHANGALPKVFILVVHEMLFSCCEVHLDYYSLT